MRTNRLMAVVIAASASALACSSDGGRFRAMSEGEAGTYSVSSAGEPGFGGSATPAETGGSLATGGQENAAGAGGTGGTGGDTGTGGVPPTGGVETGGTGATGGDAGTGGVPPTGGVGTGGTGATGGDTGTGGVPPTGGVETGGTSTGGSLATGGDTGTGGVPPTGGTGTGGAPPTPSCTQRQAVTYQQLPGAFALPTWSYNGANGCVTCLSNPCLTCTWEWGDPIWHASGNYVDITQRVTCVGSGTKGSSCSAQSACSMNSTRPTNASALTFGYVPATDGDGYYLRLYRGSDGMGDTPIRMDGVECVSPVGSSTWSLLVQEMRDAAIASVEDQLFSCP